VWKESHRRQQCCLPCRLVLLGRRLARCSYPRSSYETPGFLVEVAVGTLSVFAMIMSPKTRPSTITCCVDRHQRFISCQGVLSRLNRLYIDIDIQHQKDPCTIRPLVLCSRCSELLHTRYDNHQDITGEPQCRSFRTTQQRSEPLISPASQGESPFSPIGFSLEFPRQSPLSLASP
jgi:hypothetical protein